MLVKRVFHSCRTLHWCVIFLFASAIREDISTAEANVVETTLAMVKPDGVRGDHVEAIKAAIRASGFKIVAENKVHLTEPQAREFYAEHSERNFFHDLVGFMTSGPIVAMLLEKSNAVAEWRALIGPTDPSKARDNYPQSIRAKCGADTQRNCVHGSDSHLSAAREIAFFFGETYTEVDDNVHQEL